MILFLIFFRSILKITQIQGSWDNYYPNDKYNVEKTGKISLIFEGASETNIYIHNCIAEGIHNNNGNGGAIFCSLYSEDKVLVESSTFFDCSSSGDGGCIYIKYGQYTSAFICGSSCKSNYMGQFESINMRSSGQYIREIGSSITHTNGNQNNIYITGQDSVLSNINISHSSCSSVSAIFCSSSSQNISFASFSNNTANSKLFEALTKNQYIIYSNFIANKQNTREDGLFTISSNSFMYISNSYFDGNTAPSYIFYGKFSLINCSITKDQLSHNDESSFDTKQMTPEHSFINELYFINTAYCDAPTKTPDFTPLQTDIPSPSLTEITESTKSTSTSTSQPHDSSTTENDPMSSSSSNLSSITSSEETYSSNTSNNHNIDGGNTDAGDNNSTILIIVIVLIIIIVFIIIGIVIYCLVKRRKNAFFTETSDWLVGYDIQVV